MVSPTERPDAQDAASARTLDDLDFRRLLERLATHTRTSVGHELARKPHFFGTEQAVDDALTDTTEVRALIERGDPPPFGGISDVRPTLAHATKRGVLEPEELKDIADTLRGFWMMRQFTNRHEETARRLASRAAGIADFEALQELLYESFDEHGQLADSASPELAELRARRRSLHDRVHAHIRRLLTDWDVQEHLQDSYFTVREDRYVLPVRSGERAEVQGIIHGSSQTGRTLYVEPAELVPINNELKLCEQAVIVEEHRILSLLTGRVAGRRDEIIDALEVVASVDAICARAHLAIEMDASPPQISRDGRVRLLHARNPLLMVRGVPVIPNDIELGRDCSMLVITGPNAGGKTVTLSTLGLCALMLRAGMHLPADPDSCLPVFTRVLTVIGDNQDLQSDLSTFSGHLARLRTMYDETRPGALVLLDEVAVGTEPGQGAALAIAVLEALLDRGAVGAVTTHYERLKTLSLEDPRFQNASVALDPDSKAPTYTLRRGVSGSSSALEMARRLGLDGDIVDRAIALVGDRGLSFERALERLDETREALEAERRELAADRDRLAQQIKALKAQEAEVESEADELVEKRREAALAELADARQAIRDVVRSIQKEPTSRNAQRRRVKLAEVERQLGPTPGRRTETTSAPETLAPQDAVVGATVFVPAFERDGRIEEIRGNNAVVAVGPIKTTVAIASLRPPPERIRESRPAPPTSHIRELEPPPRAADNTVDVRGHRLDEAWATIEKALDKGILENRSAIYVLHGHGTGRLKAGIRDRLRRSPYAERMESATADRGGDAVTLVWLE